MKLASRLILAHPLGYLNRVFKEYTSMYCPLDLYDANLRFYERDPALAYYNHNYCSPDINAILYPNAGHPDANLINRKVAEWLSGMCNNFLLRGILDSYYASELWLSHLMVIVALAFSFYTWRDAGRRTKAKSVYSITVAVTLLFFTAASSYFATALVEVATPRYSIGCGDLELHLMFMISAFAVMLFMVPAGQRLLTELKRNPRFPLLPVACFGSIFVLSVIFGWLLALAYPQGITSGETSSYWYTQANFCWFAPSTMDWYRTVVYGTVLKLCSQLGNPTAANYWLNTVIFSINSGVVFCLGRKLFDSVKVAYGLALATLIFEFTSMHMFFHHLQVAADPFFAEIAYLGVLLALIAWYGSNQRLFLFAYLFLGLAIFTKPVGYSLIPVFTCFAVFFWSTERNRGVKCGKVLLVSILLLIAPMVLLATRNYCLYGYPKTLAHGGMALLQATLPLLTHSDKLFDDAKKNADFILVVENCTTANQGVENVKGSPDWIVRNFRYRQYFLFGPRVIGPFDYLGGVQHPDQEERSKMFFDSRRMLAMDQLCMKLALRIVVAHPVGYIQRVFKEYISMYCPLDLYGVSWLFYQRDPDLAYYDYNVCPPDINAVLYPHAGHPDPKLVNRRMAGLLADMCENRLLRFVLDAYYASELCLSHLMGAAALAFSIYTWRQGGQRTKLGGAYGIAVTITLLFFTAASTYFVTALVEIATPRYSVGGGELELHLMFMVGLFIAVRELSTVISSRRQLSRKQSLPNCS
jgi:hypothetical protein